MNTSESTIKGRLPCHHTKSTGKYSRRQQKRSTLASPSTLSWNSHIDTVTKMSNQTLFFLQCNLTSCPKDIKAASYKTLIRPQLEYAAEVWNPTTKIGINKVQRRAASICQNYYLRASSFTSMIQSLGWEELQYRCEYRKTVIMYRIVNNLIDIPAEKHLIHSGTSARGLETQLLVPYCTVNAYKSFSAPQQYVFGTPCLSTVTAPSLDAFKSFSVGAGPVL